MNDAPVAIDDAYTMAEDTLLTVLSRRVCWAMTIDVVEIY